MLELFEWLNTGYSYVAQSGTTRRSAGALALFLLSA